MKRSEALALVALMQAAWPFREFPQETVNLYAEELLPFDAALTGEGIRFLIRTKKYLPSVAEVLEVAVPTPRPELPAPDREPLPPVDRVDFKQFLRDHPNLMPKFMRREP